MDQITAAAAAGLDDEVARLSAIANLETVDRRRQATPLPFAEADDLAADKVRDELRTRILRARARGDVHGEADAIARLDAFETGLSA